jgi:AraC-like DNA-binding protein
MPTAPHTRPHHREFEPPQALKNAIKCFWYDRRDAGALSQPFEVLPDGYAEIIFHIGDACAIATESRIHRLPSPFLMGLLNQPVTLAVRGRLDIIGIRCYPWAVFDPLGLAPGKTSVRMFEHPIATLHATLKQCIEADRIDEALHHVERHFMRTHATVDRMLARAGAAMREANGTLTVSEVAAAAHASVRTLERKFKQSSGHTVKEVSGLMRFEQVRNALFHRPQASIAGLAQALGYVDQSHLSREFKRYTGTTPAAFARRQPRGDVGGFVQA